MRDESGMCAQGRFGNGAGGIVLLAIPLLSFFNATVISMGTNARMLWSFSRDRGTAHMMSMPCNLPLMMHGSDAESCSHHESQMRQALPMRAARARRTHDRRLFCASQPQMRMRSIA